MIAPHHKHVLRWYIAKHLSVNQDLEKSRKENRTYLLKLLSLAPHDGLLLLGQLCWRLPCRSRL